MMKKSIVTAVTLKESRSNIPKTAQNPRRMTIPLITEKIWTITWVGKER